jgi:prolyl-tRNA editing enzyme YbaK/EbsC (Cys-tRNA(Pro) deacylase)
MEETQMYRKILTALHGLQFEEFTHEHVHSSNDAAKVRGTSLEEAAKAIVLETGSKKLVQCIISGHRKIDLKKLKALLKEKNIALADPEKVFLATGCKVGSVPPMGNLFEPPIPVYADADVLSREHVVFSAGSHYHSIRMRSVDWAALVKPIVVDVGKDGSAILL